MTDAPFSQVEHEVSPDELGERLDVVVGALPAVETRSKAARLIEEGLVLVDGEARPKKYLVTPGEWVSVTLPPPRASTLEPELIPLDIRYEDEELIVLSKPAGLIVHPAQGHWSGTLVNALLAHSLELGKLQGAQRPGIVHRLDKDTSGLMLVGKTDRAQARLQDAIRVRDVDRRYLALAHGWIAPRTGMIEAPIIRDPRDRTRRSIGEGTGAKHAITTFEVRQRFEPATARDDGFTLLECKLYTGRTHQIRVHLRSIGHPIVGDATYGRGSTSMNCGLTRQFLHAHSLKFTHPVTGEELHFSDELPADLQAVINSLELA
jgi:23S rRNA pseudouridine1911/1915/1917 synthase